MLTTSQIQGGETGGLCNSPSQYPRVSNSKEGCRSILKTRLSALFQQLGCESRADSCTETTRLMQCVPSLIGRAADPTQDITLLVNNFQTIYSNCPPAALLAVSLPQTGIGIAEGLTGWAKYCTLQLQIFTLVALLLKGDMTFPP